MAAGTMIWSHLEQLLAACPSSKRKLVITDSLFSMDGDFADLHGLVRLRRRYGFALALDEAHATLVAGSRYRVASCQCSQKCRRCVCASVALTCCKAQPTLIAGELL